MLFVCYDNQAYMNTGVQRSGATPPLARTTTTPVVGTSTGSDFGQGKSAPLIAMAHEIPYVATATVADLRDLEAKVHRAMALRGARYLHVLVPCPVGWGSAASDTIRVARLATESGLFPVFEAERGEVIGSTPIRHQVPVTDYLRLQARYSHLFQPEPRMDLIAPIQDRADRNIRRFRLWRVAIMTDLPFAITSIRVPARATEPAPGVPSDPSMWTCCHRATKPARRGRTSSAGSTSPRRATTRPRGGSSCGTTRSLR